MKSSRRGASNGAGHNSMLSVPDFHKDQFIQNCLTDCYVATEEDLSPEKAKIYFEANHNKLNQDQRKVFDYIKGLIGGNNKEEKLMFFGCSRRKWENIYIECDCKLDTDARKRSCNISNIRNCCHSSLSRPHGTQ